MADIEKEVMIVVRGQNALGPALQGTQKELQATQAHMQATGTQMRTTGMMITAAGAAGLLATNHLVNSAAETEQAYARVNTMLGQGEDALKDYGDAIKKLTTEIPIQGGEVAALDGMYQVLSAGIERGAEATMVLEAAMKAAVGGMTSTEKSVDILTTALNAYQLEGTQASLVTSQLSKVVQLGKTTYDALASSLGPVLAIAAQLGVGLEQVGASMATLTKAGISTDIAATSLRATLMSFLSPSEAMAKAIKDMGHESGSAMLEALGFQGSLEALAEATGGSKEELVEMFPNVRALTAVLPLTGEMASVAADDLEAMGNAAGTAGEMFEKMADTTEARLEILNNRFQQAKDSLAEGATPAMMALREASVRAMEAIAGLNKETHGAVGGMLAVGSAIATTIGPLLMAIGQYTLYRAAKLQIALINQKEQAGYLVTTGAMNVNTTATGFATSAKIRLTYSYLALKAAMSSTMGIMGLATLAIVGITLAVGAAFKAYEDFKQETKEVREENRKLMDIMDDGTESFKENKKAIDDVGRTLPILAKEMTITAMEEHALNDEFKRGTDDALQLRQAYIDLRMEEVEKARSSNKLIKHVIDETGAREDLRAEITADADELFGAVLTEEEALSRLTTSYGMSEDAAQGLIDTVETLTARTLGDAMAARDAAWEREKAASALAAADEVTRNSQMLLGLSTEELSAKMSELKTEQEDLIRLANLQSDPALKESYIGRAFAITEEMNATTDMIELRESEVSGIYDAAAGYDRLTDAVIGTFAATADLASELGSLEFAPNLNTQLAILDKKLKGVADTWSSIFSPDEDMSGLVEELIKDSVEGVPGMVEIGMTGEAIIQELVNGLEAQGISVSDAIFNILREYVAAYLELHSPAQKGPLAKVDRYWEPMGEMLTSGLKRGMRKPGVSTAASDVAGSARGPPQFGREEGRRGGGLNIYGDINITVPPGSDGKTIAREFMETLEDTWQEG